MCQGKTGITRERDENFLAEKKSIDYFKSPCRTKKIFEWHPSSVGRAVD